MIIIYVVVIIKILMNNICSDVIKYLIINISIKIYLINKIYLKGL